MNYSYDLRIFFCMYIKIIFHIAEVMRYFQGCFTNHVSKCLKAIL